MRKELCTSHNKINTFSDIMFMYVLNIFTPSTTFLVRIYRTGDGGSSKVLMLLPLTFSLLHHSSLSHTSFLSLSISCIKQITLQSFSPSPHSTKKNILFFELLSSTIFFTSISCASSAVDRIRATMTLQKYPVFYKNSEP